MCASHAVALEAGLVESPPFAELGTAELQPFDLAEVDAVSLGDESRDGVGIVERWAAYEKVLAVGVAGFEPATSCVPKQAL